MTEDVIKSPKVLGHLGPCLNQVPVRAFNSICERCFQTFRTAVGGDVRRGGEKPRQHLITRMMYLSESTSTAVRLNATWALSLPAMSLVRDRYEQVVRFSWLARQADHGELAKYIGSYYAKANKVFRRLQPHEQAEFEKLIGKLPGWMTAAPSREEKAYLDRWSSLALDAMAAKRDALKPLANTPLDQEELAGFYAPVYQQFSSVTHFDMYSMNLMGLHHGPGEVLVLAPDPWWPALLLLYDALFSLIQCHEAVLAFYGADRPDLFSDLHEEWRLEADVFLRR